MTPNEHKPDLTVHGEFTLSQYFRSGEEWAKELTLLEYLVSWNHEDEEIDDGLKPGDPHRLRKHATLLSYAVNHDLPRFRAQLETFVIQLQVDLEEWLRETYHDAVIAQHPEWTEKRKMSVDSARSAGDTPTEA